MSKLDRIQLSFRCPARWEDMEGDDRRRFCSHCRKEVHDLSSMSREDAETLLASQSRPCVRFVRSADGTTVFKGCPNGDAKRQSAARAATAGLVAGGMLAVAGCHAKPQPPALMGEISLPAVESVEGVESPPLMGTPVVREPD